MMKAVGQAYLDQAREDLKTAKLLGTRIVEAPSTFCMLMQMVFEKLAKADKYRKETKLPEKTNHEAAGECFAKYFELCTRAQKGLRTYANLLPTIKQLEAYNPSIAKKRAQLNGQCHQHPDFPQLEYPWDDADGKIYVPCKDLPLVKEIKKPTTGPRMAGKLLKFAEYFSQYISRQPDA